MLICLQMCPQCKPVHCKSNFQQGLSFHFPHSFYMLQSSLQFYLGTLRAPGLLAGWGHDVAFRGALAVQAAYALCFPRFTEAASPLGPWRLLGSALRGLRRNGCPLVGFRCPVQGTKFGSLLFCPLRRSLQTPK